STWCQVSVADGTSLFLQNHTREEREHMLKIIQYLKDLKIDSVIPQIQKPTQKMKSLEQVCKISLDNERNVSKAIHKIINTAQKENDHRTNFFLEWFVREQIEEEDLFESILQKFDVIGRDKLAIHEIDKILNNLSQKSN
ncbi:MAG: ferritin, partial [Candidatus Nitrosopelagicus sp.]|nr:ferritin [Candidatus Nitrosopelagicus sp.]